ncbi:MULTISPECIES: DUF7504 family protein [Halolamina]|uniref:Uncharacterized protein n=1 Tax=Halolamina pelagica TaxID=699431 RepID=A0A1I5NL48_9EURY|nr:MULTISPECIES: hypothetical protein [Halolamina]NHX36373.1 hypothetical protein [Halolamina sp. R1-12]SFP22519.1 hypothetical protein SAMN05216277_10287 [Halolamina pelagica]
MSRPVATCRGGGSVRRTLQELKRRGAQVLVIGDVPEAVSRRATRRLLGHPDEERYRVLALTDSGVDDAAWLPGEYAPEDDEVALIGEPDLRGDAVADSPVQPGRADDTVRRIDAQIREWEPDGTPSPAVLRAGVYSLETLLEAHGVEAVRTLTARLTGAVRRVRGVGHYHLPRAPDSDAVADLDSVFDARLELRTAATDPEQRWHLPGRGTTSWVALGEP